MLSVGRRLDYLDLSPLLSGVGEANVKVKDVLAACKQRGTSVTRL